MCNSEKGRVGKSKIHSRFDLFFQFSKKVERFGKLKINCQTKFSISISLLAEIEKLFNSRENGKRLWKEKEDFFRREKVAEV